MTVKEIAESVNRTERSVRNWANKVAEKSSVMAEKISSSTSTHPADYTLDETVEIIKAGLGANAASLYRQNASHASPEENGLINTKDIMPVLAMMMKQQQDFMTAVLSEVRDISSSQKQIEAPRQDCYSLTGYCKLKGIRTNVSELPGIGMKLRDKTIAEGLELRKVPDERWGLVNSYPVEVLDAFFTP